MHEDVLEARRRAVEEAMRVLLSFKRDVVGIGTGSTVDLIIDFMASSSHLFTESHFVCASMHTARRLSENGFKILDLANVDSVDIYIDGADEVDPDLNMVKGGGGASTLEKILASTANIRIYVVDYTKLVKNLGERHPIPVEVLHQALSIVYRKLKELGLNPSIRRSREGKYGFVVADTGGVIIDVYPKAKFNPRELNLQLKSIPGVIETGIFTNNLVDFVIVGHRDTVTVLRKEKIGLDSRKPKM